MRETRNTIILAAIIVAGFVGMGILIHFDLRSSGGVSASDIRKIAANLESRGLWAQAAKEYDKLLNAGNASNEDRAKIYFHVGEIYLDHLSDAGSALPYLLTAKLFTGDSGLSAKADKRIVEAFEKTGRSVDAANFLSNAASIEPQAVSTKEVVLAKIGSKTVTLRDLNEEIQSLLPQMQEQFQTLDKKIELLNSIVARELLTIAANRAGYNNDPDVEFAAQRARQAVILSKYQQREIDSKIRITEADVRNYYEGNKDKFTDKDKKQLPYEQAKEQARAMLEAERRRQAIDDIISRLQQSEGVEVYSDRIPSK